MKNYTDLYIREGLCQRFQMHNSVFWINQANFKLDPRLDQLH